MFYIELIALISVYAIVFATFIKGGGKLFSPISLYCYLFTSMYLLRHTFLFLGLDSPMPDEYFVFDSQETRIFTLIAVLLWSAGFYLSLLGNISYQKVASIFPQTPNVLNYKHMHLANIVLFTVTLGITVSLIAKFGFDISAISYEVRMNKYFSGLSFLTSLNVFSAYLLATTAFVYYVRGGVNNKRYFSFYSILAFIAILPSFLMADRDNLIFFFVFYYFGLCIYISSRLKIFTVPLVILAIWGIVIMQKVRLSNWGYDKEYSSIFRQISSGLNHQFYDSFILLVKGVQDNWFFGQGLRYGEDFLLGLIGVIPRSLWEEKPKMVDPGIWFSNQFIEGATYGWPISNIGEWWFNFSIIGVVVGGFFSGILYKAISTRYKHFEQQPLAWFVIFFLATRILPLGYTTSTPMYVVLNLVPIALLFIFIGRRFGKRV